MSQYVLILIMYLIYTINCYSAYSKGYIKQDYTDIDTKNITYRTDALTVCPYFQKSNLQLEKMADVWQTVIHTAADEVPCFKILIRKVGKAERKSNEARYGTFKGDVLWDNCTLEIKSMRSKISKSRHFLQKTAYNGVMKNIIIEIGATTKLEKENPDQWFLRKNLLIMRDCFVGDIVIFSRVPYQPSRTLIEDTFKVFKGRNASWTCDHTLKPINEDQ